MNTETNKQRRVTISSYYDSTRYSNEKRDCVVRAIAVAGEISYKNAHELCQAFGRKPRHGVYVAEILIDSLFPNTRLQTASGGYSLHSYSTSL